MGLAVSRRRAWTPQHADDTSRPVEEFSASATPSVTGSDSDNANDDTSVEPIGITSKTTMSASNPHPRQSLSSEDDVAAPRRDCDAAILRELRTRLVELNLGISQAQKRARGPLVRPNRLVEERNAVCRALDSVVFYPILTVPPEIMEEIFVYCLPDNGGGDDPPTPDPTKAPLLLLKVCTHWRNIALATPRLWASIRVNLRSQNLHKSLELFEHWLERARSRPLSVAVVYTNYEENPSPAPLISALTRSSVQWQDLRLELPFSDLQQLNGVEGRVPLLRKLLIGPTDAYDAGMQAAHTVPITAFSEAPALREVHLVTGFPFTLELPWAQLTRLEATSLSVCEALEILEASPALVSCVLSLRQSFDTLHAERIAPLCSLEVLTLRTSGFHIDLLDRLTLPVLRELQFHVTSVSAGEESLAKFGAFLERSDGGSCLTQIYFSGMLDLYENQLIVDLAQNGTRIGPPPVESPRR